MKLSLLFRSHCLVALIVAVMLTRAAAEPKSFSPSWDSLKSGYAYPDWFRDAKFGIWAHWGPQCQPGQGDWYAHEMYNPEHRYRKYHLEHYGHPSEFGFKDVINTWKAENWKPDELLAFYRRVGARYFVAMANHHDNFDNWDSKHHEWNSVDVGPKKDIVGGWAAAARAAGLRFGVSVHASTAWSWYEITRTSDTTGPKTGVPYDGGMTKAEGKGKWWEGLDPAKLYLPHTKGERPTDDYVEDFYARTVDVIDQHKPDFVYFDEAVLPLHRRSDVGLRIAAHFFNANQQWHNGSLEAVITAKRLDLEQRRAITLDIERSVAIGLEPLPWESGTCLGYWHYQQDLFDDHKYKTASQVVRLLVDVVSKNGNLLLSVPLRGDGTLDDDERKILDGIGEWLAVNGNSIYATRPWRIYGEGPSVAEKPQITRFGAAEEARMAKPYTAEDFRFTTKGNLLYAIALEWPQDSRLQIRSLARDVADRTIRGVRLLGTDASLEWAQTDRGLEVKLPATKPCEHAYVLEID